MLKMLYLYLSVVFKRVGFVILYFRTHCYDLIGKLDINWDRTLKIESLSTLRTSHN